MEDFTTYTELDDNSHLSQTSTKVTFTGLARNEDAWVYIDKGVDAFAGNFTHTITVNVTATDTNGRAFVWGLTNTVDDMQGIDDASGFYFGIMVLNAGGQEWIYENYLHGGTLSQDDFAITLNTPCYLTIVRDESIGTYGRLNTYIYSDSDRTDLLDTLLHNLSEKTDFRYIFAANTLNTGTSETMSGYCENFLLEDASAPTLTTSAVTNIGITTATGNGAITSVGSSAVAQYGHCWAESADPTTAGSKTTKGAGEVWTFISDITGLTANTLYHVRAYATNGQGTSYGADVTFTAGATDTPVVTTQSCTALTDTTATGNGTITSVGGSEVTEHGHCWNTSINPTTSNSKTTNGLGYYGAFTSAITSLTASTTYYIRAYATNTDGTAYGNNVKIVASTGSNELAGPIGVVETRLHYVDKYGRERYVEGTPI